MKESKDNGPGQRSSLPWKILCGIFLVGALVCIIMVCAGALKKKEAQDAYESLAEQTNLTGGDESTRPEGETGSSPSEVVSDSLKQAGVPVPEKTVDFSDLQKNTNADIYSWIYIPDTLVDYPVVQHATDNNYYLNHNLDGSSGYPGCIYSEDYNKKDFSDPVTVLYGHNMKNGSMFAGLHKYGDAEYMKEHPYVYVYTEDKLYVYEIFAAYEYGNDHLLYEHDYSEGSQFSTYIEDIKNIRDMNKVIREDVEVTTEDRILTLSTCISNKAESRFLVQGVLLNEE